MRRVATYERRLGMRHLVRSVSTTWYHFHSM